MDRGDGCTNVNVFNATLYLKMVKMVNFICILPQYFLKF